VPHLWDIDVPSRDSLYFQLSGLNRLYFVFVLKGGEGGEVEAQEEVAADVSEFAFVVAVASVTLSLPVLVLVTAVEVVVVVEEVEEFVFVLFCDLAHALALQHRDVLVNLYASSECCCHVTLHRQCLICPSSHARKEKGASLDQNPLAPALRKQCRSYSNHPLPEEEPVKLHTVCLGQQPHHTLQVEL